MNYAVALCRMLALLAIAALPACGGTGGVPGGLAPLADGRGAVPQFDGVALDIPPRLQWEGNFGYCGEVSMISAGLYYGQYVSQYEARRVASDGVPQYLQRSQLLLGSNALHAAAQLHLNAVAWHVGTETSTQQFLLWVKHYLALGYPVTIGVYTNEYRFYGKTKPAAGDASYDHIVPVTGMRSNHPLTDGAYFANDRLIFSDNGLWGNPSDTPYIFTYRLGAMQRTRVQANAPKAPLYSLASDGKNYGIAVTGVADLNHDTLPVRLSTNVNYEKPAIVNGSNKRPAAMPLVLTIAISNLVPGVSYRLYRYRGLASVPDSQFNAHAARASQRWTIRISAGSTYAFSQRIQSDQVAVYRAVPASAP